MASKTATPLDAAFLRRVYRTTLWFGVLMAVCAFNVTRSPLITSSFVLGIGCGALMLKSQEFFVYRVLRAGEAMDGIPAKPRFPVWAVLAIKYTLLVGALEILFHLGLIHPAAFATGFMTEHVVIVSKVAGHFISQQIRPVSEVHES